jgi:hypothetical protein
LRFGVSVASPAHSRLSRALLLSRLTTTAQYLPPGFRGTVRRPIDQSLSQVNIQLGRFRLAPLSIWYSRSHVRSCVRKPGIEIERLAYLRSQDRVDDSRPIDAFPVLDPSSESSSFLFSLARPVTSLTVLPCLEYRLPPRIACPDFHFEALDAGEQQVVILLAGSP